MKNHFEFRRYGVIVLFCLLFLFSSTNLYSQAYNYSGTLSYLDGTPFKLYGANIDDFGVDLVTAPDLYAGYVSNVKNGTITLSCVVTGTYTLEFMGMEIARFEVSKQKDEFISNLPKQLNLPFNYIATTKPNQIVKVYDDNINLIESFQADENGYVPLKGNEKYFSNKFLVIEPENQFPQPAFFKEIKPANVGELMYRMLRFPSQKLQAKRGLVHNIKDDNYYTLREGSFNIVKDKKLLLLLKYEVGLQKGSIHKMDFSGYKKAAKTNLFLDEDGKVIVVLQHYKTSTTYEYQSFIVSKNGNIQITNDAYVYPIYRFKDNFVKDARWIIPTFMGIALNEGAHNFNLTCSGKWIEPNPANESLNKLNAEINILVKEIDKAFAEGRDIGDSKSKMLAEKRKVLWNTSVAPAINQSGSIKSNESFQVIFDPDKPNLWKIDGDYNPYKTTDPERDYYPSGLDPESKINGIDLKECFISVDGTSFDYSYKDPYACKGIMYTDFDSDEQRKEAMAACVRNAPVIMGFEGEGSAWGIGFALFEDKQSLVYKDPINLWEGPYSELRYKTQKVAGEYNTIKEARKHCKTPVKNRDKWVCYDYDIISVCLDNYQFSVDENGRVTTNYDALYCGEMDPETSLLKDDEIAVEGNIQDGEIEEKAYDWLTDLEDITTSELPNFSPSDENDFESENEQINNSNVEETLKQIVCASAKPSIVGGSVFKRAKFTIGGTEPQEVKITSSAENFAIKKEYGGLVYQVIDGTSWGNLTLEPGSYILSCNGGGAMGLMSASVCIKNPMAGQVLPPDVPPVLPTPDEDGRPTLEDSKPPLPKGPIEKIFVRSDNPDDYDSNHLTMLIGVEKNIAVWGEDAVGHKINVTIDDWKVYDDDIGWITKGLHNPAPKDASVKIKFKAGDKKGYTRIKATVINKENRRINGVLFIEVTEDPPIIVTGCVKLYDENDSPVYAGEVAVELNVAWYKNRMVYEQTTKKAIRPISEVKPDRNGKFKFVVQAGGGFAVLNCSINSYYIPSPPGYEWDMKSLPNDIGASDGTTFWIGKVDPGNTSIFVSPESFPCLSLWLERTPITFSIDGEVTYRGNPVEGAKVRLVGNGKTLKEDVSNYDGEYWLDVGNLPNGKYKLTAKYAQPRYGEPGYDPNKKMTMHQGWLYIDKNIWVDLPLKSETKTININMISFGEKIGYTGP